MKHYKHILSLLFASLLLTGCATVAYDTTKTVAKTTVGFGEFVVKTTAKTVAGTAKLAAKPFIKREDQA